MSFPSPAQVLKAGLHRPEIAKEIGELKEKIDDFSSMLVAQGEQLEKLEAIVSSLESSVKKRKIGTKIKKPIQPKANRVAPRQSATQSKVAMAIPERNMSDEVRRSSTLKILNHAYKCQSRACSQVDCPKMKRALGHEKVCKVNASGGCGTCKQLMAVHIQHAKQCAKINCPVVGCANTKYKLQIIINNNKQQQKQPQSQAPDLLQASNINFSSRDVGAEMNEDSSPKKPMPRIVRFGDAVLLHRLDSNDL